MQTAAQAKLVLGSASLLQPRRHQVPRDLVQPVAGAGRHQGRADSTPPVYQLLQRCRCGPQG